jgi:hypothetical protein
MDNRPIRLTPVTRPKVLQAIATAADGVYVSIKESKRSLEQNSRMWAMLGDVAKQVVWTVNGHAEKLSAEEWKTIITASLNQENRMAPGVRGGFVMLGVSTSAMTIKQMTDVIEFLFSFGADQDVIWSEKTIIPEWAH